MPQPQNTYSSNDMVGIREDLSDAIWDVSPSATPFLSAMKKVKAKNTFHEWQTDSLRSSADNVNVEGADLTAAAISPTTRLGNYTQILTEAATVSDTDRGLNKAGRAREMAYQLKKKTKEIKLDAERALFLNNAREAGSDIAGRELAGAQVWFTTNTSGGSGASDATGDGTDTRTAGTPRALTQAIFDSMMQSRWDNSSATDSVKVFLSSGQMDVANGFTGMNNQRTQVKSGRVENMLDVYVTQWGTVEFEMSRECPTSEVFIMDMDYWCLAELTGLRNFALAKTGLAEKRGMDWECTLVCKNEAASALIADLS